MLSAPRAGAQDSPRTPRTVWREVRHVPPDVGWVLIAPGRLDAKDLPAVAGVLGATALLSLADDDIDRWIVRDSASLLLRALRPVREGARFQPGELPTGTRLPLISAGMYVIGLAAGKPGLREAGLGCISAWSASGIVRYSLYLTMHRQRPDSSQGNQYNIGLGGRSWEYQSFFGGHMANAMACSTFWAARFDLGAGEPALYLFSGAVGLSRMADRRHWASDTFLGAAFGYAVGRSVAARSLRRASRGAPASPLPLVTVRLRFR